jgi:hypothetical protein
MKRLALAVALGACAGSAALAADFSQPAPVPAQPICNPVLRGQMSLLPFALNTYARVSRPDPMRPATRAEV